MGSLQFLVTIVHRPLVLHDVHAKADLADVLEQMAKAIVSQLELDEVLSRALEMALTVVEAEEAAIVLADKQTGELFVEAERRAGSDKTDSRRRKIEDPLAAKVIRTGEPLKASSRMDETQIRIRDNMLVDALSYVPIKLGGVSFGVLLVTHRQEGKKFTQRDQRLLGAITDFAAIALQNSRLYQSTREADQVKDEMIQNISHEFRTPLSFILGFTQFVLEDAKEGNELNELQIDYLRLSVKHAHKLEWLVDNFVTIQSAQDIAPNKEPTGVVTMLDEALESVRFRADELNITVTLKVGNDMPLVMIDRMAISQVVDNLLSNALKFTPRGGDIDVHAALMPSGKVHISIVNTGMGVPDEERERIFEKFVQVDGTTTRSFGGVGIGLAVCKAVIDSHKEKIWVESESGKGATFIFSLPPV